MKEVEEARVPQLPVNREPVELGEGEEDVDDGDALTTEQVLARSSCGPRTGRWRSDRAIPAMTPPPNADLAESLSMHRFLTPHLSDGLLNGRFARRLTATLTATLA